MWSWFAKNTAYIHCFRWELAEYLYHTRMCEGARRQVYTRPLHRGLTLSFYTSVYFLLSGHSPLASILKNTVCYYQQFLPAVTSHCDKVTAPVEKEFKVSIFVC